MIIIKFSDINTDDRWVTKNTCGIYMIENLINNKKYIGQSKQIKTRWTSHTNRCNSPTDCSYNSQLYTDMRECGFENFKFSVLEECKESELDERETYYIKVFDTFKSGYNGNIGGFGSQKFTDEEFKEYFLSHPKIGVNEIAKIFNIDRSVAGRKLKSLGLKSNWGIKEEEIKEAIRLYKEENLSIESIAKILNRDSKNLSNKMREYGFTETHINSQSRRATRTNKSKTIYVYDIQTNKIFTNFRRKDFEQYLYDLGYTQSLNSGAISCYLARNGKLLYGNFIVRKDIDSLNQAIEHYKERG